MRFRIPGLRRHPKATLTACDHPDRKDGAVLGLFRQHSQVIALLNDIDRKVTAIMAAQDDVASAAAAMVSAANAIQTVAADLTAAVAKIQAAIAALQAANPTVNTDALNAAVAGLAAPLAALQSADAAVDALETPAPAPPSGS